MQRSLYFFRARGKFFFSSSRLAIWPLDKLLRVAPIREAFRENLRFEADSYVSQS